MTYIAVFGALIPALYVLGRQNAIVFRLAAAGLAVGALAVASRPALVLSGSLILVLLLIWFRRSSWPSPPERSLRLNAMWAAARILVMPLPFGAGFLVALGLPRGLDVIPVPSLGWRTIIVGFVSFLAADLTNYWSHRLRHRVPALWNFHEIHHSDTTLGPITTRRQHVVDYLLARTVRIIPVMLIGPQYLAGFLPWALIRGAAGYYHHSATTVEFGPLRYLITTPAAHRLHHSTNPAHFGCNFSPVLIIWDRIFGTYLAPTGQPVSTGVVDSSLPNETDDDRALIAVFFAQFIHPFRKLGLARVLPT